MRPFISLILTLLIVLAGYKLYFSQLKSSTGGVAPVQTIEVTGVKNDLIAIGQAERMYLAEHGSYATLDQLSSSGAMAIAKTGREGYTYDAQPSGDGFRAEARCSSSASACTNYAIDETMEVHATP
jgi:hypothetical protein